MNDRELMHQALEVLERCPALYKASEVAAALREKLAHPVQFKCTIIDDEHPDGVPLSKWGRHSEQEPFCYHDGRNIVGKEYADHSDVFPLYTAPPQRKPLTNKEIIDIDDEVMKAPRNYCIKFARAIEAAHGIKE